HPHISPGAPCGSALGAETANSLEPADVAGANGYDSQPLLTANDDGGGESVGLVEFSNYINSDQLDYQACYGTSVPVGRVKVNGGTTVTSGSDEVALDQEILAAQAPGLDKIWTYVAKPSASMAAVLDKILATRKANGI